MARAEGKAVAEVAEWTAVGGGMAVKWMIVAEELVGAEGAEDEEIIASEEDGAVTTQVMTMNLKIQNTIIAWWYTTTTIIITSFTFNKL